MKMKVCGLRDPENIKQVNALNPDFLGFIFYSNSPRYAGDDFIMPELEGRAKKVGVFVDASPEHIIDMIDRHGLDAVQLHGSERADLCEVLSHITIVIKAFGIDEHFDFELLEHYEGKVQYFLFDTKTIQNGGSGIKFDHSLLDQYKGNTPFFLSGGIGPEDISELKINHPCFAGFDLNSKFEIPAGIKSISLLENALHRADHPWQTRLA